MQPGIVEWGTTPKAFFERQTAMMWTTTGNLTNVRTNAPFDFGVAMLPANKRRGAPTGGGNFYIFKDSTPEQKKASFAFIKWITAPEQAAKWTIATGYVAPRPDAWETAAMKSYVADFPPAAGGARSARARGGRALDLSEPARHQDLQRRPGGGHHRLQGRAGRGASQGTATGGQDPQGLPLKEQTCRPDPTSGRRSLARTIESGS